jgi:rhodanese-related sulfurtransferase
MAKQHSPRFLKIVQESKSRVRETNVPEVKRRLDRGERLTLVDVREDHEWANGHLPGATHLGKGVIERDAEKTFPEPSQELILYCGGGFRSALAAENLQRMGYTNVLSMDGGFTAWKEAGLPIAGAGGNPTATGEMPASPAADSPKKQGDKLGDAIP